MLIWDGYGLQSLHSGIGQHALALAEELETLGNPPVILPSVSALDPAFGRFKADLSHFPLSRLKPLSLLAAGYQAQTLARASKTGKAPLFHGLSNYNVPNLPKHFKKIVTVHDLIPFIFPEGVSRSLHRYLSHQMPKALERADAIVCVSEWTACSVKNQFPHVKDKVIVIPNGRPDRKEKQTKPENEPLRILTISRGETYKRLSFLTEIQRSLGPGFTWHVVTDGKGRSQLSSNDQLIVHQSLSEEALNDVWSGTDIFVHPSLWEGYCLPAVAALSRGIPGIYTGGSGIDEVLGEAGIKLSRSDKADDWADAIVRLSRERQNFENRCVEQWQRLSSWPEVARQLSGLYDKITL